MQSEQQSELQGLNLGSFQSDRVCSSCLTIAPPHQIFKKCSACKSRQYCNSVCQKKHWKSFHRSECKKLQTSKKAAKVRATSSSSSIPAQRNKIEIDMKDAAFDANKSTEMYPQHSMDSQTIMRHTGKEQCVSSPSEQNWPVSNILWNILLKSNNTLQSYYQGILFSPRGLSEMVTCHMNKGIEEFLNSKKKTMNASSSQQKDQRKMLLGSKLCQIVPTILIMGLFSFHASQEKLRMEKKKKKTKQQIREHLGVIVIELPMNKMIEDCVGSEIVALHYLKRKQYKEFNAREVMEHQQQAQSTKKNKKNQHSEAFQNVKEKWDDQKIFIEQQLREKRIPVIIRFRTKAYDLPIATRMQAAQPLVGKSCSFDENLKWHEKSTIDLFQSSGLHSASSFLFDLKSKQIDALDFDSSHFIMHMQKQ